MHYCSDSEVGSQAPGAKMRSPDFVVRFSLYGTWDNSTYGSASASKGCSFVNYFCKQGFAISTLPPKDAENKLCHCWPCERQSRESPERNLTFPSAELNLRNTAVPLGGRLEVNTAYLSSVWQVLVFILIHIGAAGPLSRMSDPASACLRESFFFQTHGRCLSEPSK